MSRKHQNMEDRARRVHKGQPSDLFEMRDRSQDPTIYFDGGCAPNPGKMSCGIVVCLPGRDVVAHKIEDLGQGTNNVAEWGGLLWATLWARENGYTHCNLIGDSQLAIKQAQGKWSAHNPLLGQMVQEFKVLAEGMSLDITHVLRDMNLAGVYLEHGELRV